MYSIYRKNLVFKYYFIIIYLLKIINSQRDFDEMVCSLCDHKISNSLFLTDEISNASIESKRKIRFNKNILVHTFKNPQKIKFQVITTKRANLICDEKEYEDNTFFEGFSWRICTCPVCGSHHGWLFSPIEGFCDYINNGNKTVCISRRKFYGIITTRLKDSQYNGEIIDL